MACNIDCNPCATKSTTAAVTLEAIEPQVNIINHDVPEAIPKESLAATFTEKPAEPEIDLDGNAEMISRQLLGRFGDRDVANIINSLLKANPEIGYSTSEGRFAMAPPKVIEEWTSQEKDIAIVQSSKSAGSPPAKVEEEDEGPKPQMKTKKTLVAEGEVQADELLEDERPAPPMCRSDTMATTLTLGDVNRKTLAGSALNLGKNGERLVYLIALGGVIFVLAMGHIEWGDAVAHSSSAEGSSDGSSASDGSSHRLLAEQMSWASQNVFGTEHPRRLEAAAVPPLMRNIAFSLLGAGLMALVVTILGQPLILGYLLGGLLIGPTGLNLVPSHEEVIGLANLGLVFLLFMIGLELNIAELLKMGKVVIMTGGLQFPTCVMLHLGIFMGFGGDFFGKGQFSTLYVALVCGISSTMIVAKALGEKMELDSKPGRLTIGILIFQDVWAIIVLAIQPNLANPEIVGILKTFGMCGVLMLFAYLYAKFVMPAVFLKASGSVELMLVMAISWCFFIGCFAILPFIGLSLELASLIAGAVLATFPYSAEFNGKLKYLRDFFVTLFFVAMGMQIPVPTAAAVGKAFIIVLVVLGGRWIGIFSIAYLAGGGGELACLATCNLSQVSEFALVIVSLGVTFEHVEGDTLVIMIFVFSILAVATAYFVTGKYKFYKTMNALTAKCRKSAAEAGGHDEHDDHHDHQDIVFLGFHRIASMLIHEFEIKNPGILKRINVVDVNQSIKPRLEKKGVHYSYGDISSADVLEHAHHGSAKLVLSTIPDSVLSQGVTNKLIVSEAMKCWPGAIIIATAESHAQKKELYEAGAHYVLVQTQLCAERLQNLLGAYIMDAFHDGELNQLVAKHSEQKEKLTKQRFMDRGPTKTLVI